MKRYHDTSIATAAQAFTEQNRKAALDAAANEQRVFPVIVTRHPDNPKKKKAEIPVKWAKEATTDPEKINAWWDKHPDATPGMVTGKNFVTDLDIGEDKDGRAEYEAMGLDPEDALFAVETPSGGEHLYFDNPYRLTISKGDDKRGIAPGIDTRGHGGFVFAPGSRTVFGEYRIKRGDLEDLKFGLLAPVPKKVRQALAKTVEPAEQPEPGHVDVEAIRDALNHVSSDCGYQDWTDILMAVHHGTGGSKHGLALALGWSAGHPQFSLKEVQTKWLGFGKKDGPQKTVATLFARARENGWDQADPNDLLTDEDVADVTDTKSRLTFLSPTECEDLPSRRYVIKGLLAEGDIGTIVGAPGAGKSLLAPYLGFMVARGDPAFGRRTRQGGVFYVAAEDGLGMRSRVRALREEHGEVDGFKLVAGLSDLLTPKSEDLKELVAAIKRDRPSLIIVDTIAVAFPGLEENDAKSMGRVVAVARHLARWGAAVLLIHHDTKDGANGLPRGHSILNGALDMNLYLKREDGAVTGKLTKNRNGSTDEKLAFTVATIPLGEDEDGDPITTALCREADAADLADREVRLSPSVNAALKVFHELGDGAPVEESEWRLACVDGREVSAADNRDSRGKAFKRAAEELSRKGILVFHGGKYAVGDSPERWLTDDDV